MQNKLERIKFEISPGDLEEKFIKGSGKGGQKMNKTSSCVELRHLPSGVIVSCQQSRYQEANRGYARKYLRDKLDDALNGAASKDGVRKMKDRRNKDRRRRRRLAKERKAE